MAKNGWFRWQRTSAAKMRKKRKIGVLFMYHKSDGSCDFNKILTAKQRKEHRDKNLLCFLFAIFAFFVVNSALVVACRAGLFEHF
jgi:hypothetical protein